MEEKNLTFHDFLLGKIRKVMKDTDLSQATLAMKAEMNASQISKILKGDLRLSIDQLSKIAKALSMSEIDLITYPEKYVPASTVNEPVKALLQIELSPEKKDQVFKLVLGEDGVKLLNK